MKTRVVRHKLWRRLNSDVKLQRRPGCADIKEHGAALAVLIDADNANPAIVEGLLAEIAKLGFASVKRIYGDWTTPKSESMESSPARTLHSTYPAICLYNRKKCHR